MAIGKSVNRTDAVAKVTGRAEYTEDMHRPGMLVAKYFRATISHGRVTEIDITEAVYTFEDVPQNLFATAGHPFSLDPHHKDIEDRLLLTRDIRYMGDEIAIVVAREEQIAKQALEKIKISGGRDFRKLLSEPNVASQPIHLAGKSPVSAILFIRARAICGFV